MLENALNSIKFPHLLSRPARFVFSSFVFSLLLGVIARGWMRWISTEPEFSWTGTLSIIIGFAAFGSVQSLVLISRAKLKARQSRALVRIVGVIFSLPLFIAAGATMFPTVLLASIALWRDNWKTWLRILLFLSGLAFWGFIIKSEIVDNFGWGFVTIAKIFLFGLIYSAITCALKPTVSAHV